MEKYLSEINYDQLVEKALKHVVIEALKIVERQGLPGDHHFMSLSAPTTRGLKWTTCCAVSTRKK